MRPPHLAQAADGEHADDSARLARGVHHAESFRSHPQDVAGEARQDGLVREAEDLAGGRQRHEQRQAPLPPGGFDEAGQALPDRTGGGGRARRVRGAPRKDQRAQERGGGGREVRDARSEAADQATREEGTRETADTHRDAEESERLGQSGGADQVVSVDLLRHLLQGARAADDDRESQDQPDRRAAEHREGFRPS